MEQRLIDANALLDTTEHLVQVCFGQGQCYYERTNVSLSTFLQLIKKQPTVDAVPVVRCGECKKWNRYKDGIKGLCGHSDHVMSTREDFYCADGARKIEAGVYVNGEVAFINGGPEDENESALDETEDVDK